MRKSVFPAAALSALLLASNTAACASPPPPPFHRGINVMGWDHDWNGIGQGDFRARHFQIIRAAGFDFIRLVADAAQHRNPDGTMKAAWLGTLDWAIQNATAAGLGVVIDEHDNGYCGDHGAECRNWLPVFWGAIAQRYRTAPASVTFEILNEPHEQMNDVWNDTVRDSIAAIRKTNPTRTVVVGPNHSDNMDNLGELVLPPDDRHILVTFHYYKPVTFTHQGAPWLTEEKNLHGITWGSATDRAAVDLDFGTVARWGQANRRPILVGEFGAFDGSGTPIDQRANWDAAIARTAEKYGFAWSYWRFEHDFYAYDMKADQWVAPIRDALIPPGTARPGS